MRIIQNKISSLPVYCKLILSYINSIVFRLNHGERAERRNIAIFSALFTNVLARTVNMGAIFISVPVTLHYLGTDRFAVWMAATSLTSFISFTDLGLGIGLQNALTKCYGKDDEKMPRYYISNAFVLLCTIAVLVFCSGLYILPLLPVEQLVKLEDISTSEVVLPTLQVVVCVFAFGLPTSVVGRVLIGYQKMHVYGFVRVIGQLLALLSIFVSVWFEFSLPMMLGLFTGGVIAAQLVFTVSYWIRNEWFRPKISCISFSIIREITGTGWWAMLAQIAYVFKSNFPVFIISSTLGAVALTQYTVVQRLLSFAIVLVNIGLSPLWPAYGEAYHSRDKQWLTAIYKRTSKMVAVLSISFFIFIVIFGIPLIELWTNGHVIPPFKLLLACSVWMVTMNFNVCSTMLLNGSNHFKGQAIYRSILTAIACCVAFIYSLKLGADGIVWTFIVCSEIMFTMFLWIKVKTVIRKMA